MIKLIWQKKFKIEHNYVSWTLYSELHFFMCWKNNLCFIKKVCRKEFNWKKKLKIMCDGILVVGKKRKKTLTKLQKLVWENR